MPQNEESFIHNYGIHLSRATVGYEDRPVHYEFLMSPSMWPSGDRVFISFPFRTDVKAGLVEKEMFIPQGTFNHWVGQSASF